MHNKDASEVHFSKIEIENLEKIPTKFFENLKNEIRYLCI